jgi:hypothetical protein
MADWGGRRRFVILFTMTYAASCLTKREYWSMFYSALLLFCDYTLYSNHSLYSF